MVLGITGISGVGKHTVAELFQSKNWVILDADKIAHYMYRPYTSVWQAVVKQFGEGILTKDDKIDRQKLSRIVFNPEDKESASIALEKLNAIVHPSVIRNMEDTIHRHFRRKSNIVIIASLWKELDLPRICDKLLYVKSSPDLAMQRVMERDGIPAPVYNMRIAKQVEPKKYDFIIENNGNKEDLRKKILDLPLPFKVE